MSVLDRSPESSRTAAKAAACGFAGIAAFQVALAAGAPLGHAAWGGADARLPTRLRVASAGSVPVYAAAALVVLGRAGCWGSGRRSTLFQRGTWALAGLMSVGAVANFASRSRWERVVWGPTALTLALLCAAVARSAPPRNRRAGGGFPSCSRAATVV
jgi:hypothetical protein